MPRTAAILFLSLGITLAGTTRARAEFPSLATLTDPAGVLSRDGEAVRFALDFFIEFESVEQLFAHIDHQAGRWSFDSAAERKAFADDLLRRGLESRWISMFSEAPRELLVTHTAQELAAAAMTGHSDADSPVFEGEHWRLDAGTYRDELLALQLRWKSSLNCWSAAPSVAERVLSNWYLIPEGITLFGADYDSTEHFWQAVKFHPAVEVADLAELLERVEALSWEPWLERLSNDQEIYLADSYTVEFLRANLSERIPYFGGKLEEYRSLEGSVRTLQQRSAADSGSPRFSALEEKIFWGDLADVFHLLRHYLRLDGGRLAGPEHEALLEALEEHHFDGIYLDGYLDGKVGFISPEFQRLMLEIWRVKFLEMERFSEVIRSTEGRRLLHFLNDGTSPDIPIPVYVGYLEEIRRLALERERSRAGGG